MENDPYDCERSPANLIEKDVNLENAIYNTGTSADYEDRYSDLSSSYGGSIDESIVELPMEPTSICSPNRVESNNTDSEDDLPSYGFKWTPDIGKVNPNINCQREELNVDEVLAERKKNREIRAKLDDLLKNEIKPSVGGSKTFNLKTDKDEDAEFIAEKAKEMKVENSTLKNAPHYVIMKPELSSTIFNHETLKLEHFVHYDSLKNLSEIHDIKFAKLEVLESFGPDSLSEEEEEGLYTFLFFVMSVHPDLYKARYCYTFLIRNSKFYPCLTDIINVLRNWGCDLHDLYVTVPSMYTGLHNSFNVVKPKVKMEIKEQNMKLVFEYLQIVITQHFSDTFCDLLEPLLRLYFDVKVHVGPLRRLVVSIVILLTGSAVNLPKEHASKRLSTKDIHIKQFSLQQQTEICKKIFGCTCFGLPLAYAILQQYLGCSKIIYCQHVSLKEIYTLLSEKKNVIVTSSYLDIFCYLEIITLLFYERTLMSKVHAQQICLEDWQDLLHDWCSRIANSDSTVDPILLHEKITKLQYFLRMKEARRIHKQSNISLHK